MYGFNRLSSNGLAQGKKKRRNRESSEKRRREFKPSSKHVLFLSSYHAPEPEDVFFRHHAFAVTSTPMEVIQKPCGLNMALAFNTAKSILKPLKLNIDIIFEAAKGGSNTGQLFGNDINVPPVGDEKIWYCAWYLSRTKPVEPDGPCINHAREIGTRIEPNGAGIGLPTVAVKYGIRYGFIRQPVPSRMPCGGTLYGYGRPHVFGEKSTSLDPLPAVGKNQRFFRGIFRPYIRNSNPDTPLFFTLPPILSVLRVGHIDDIILPLPFLPCTGAVDISQPPKMRASASKELRERISKGRRHHLRLKRKGWEDALRLAQVL
ncbi:hypothetical protein B0H17DRAFT_1137174 [Mycena rosella]|uniref:Uncharacterized protein n=1 Tax=Mycena rosella TaxID=1033263 RepID=A0AAD7DCD8_MYCRO|nr:hypothetical protein B0H17DRAFT_1137174 [Mycena rosella]